MKKKYKSIAMPCTQEQYESIKDKIPFSIFRTKYFNDSPYLVFYYDYKANTGFVTRDFFVEIKCPIHEKFDGDYFLECCGVEKNSQTLKNKEEDKQRIIDEYLKDKVWHLSDFQFKNKEGEWLNYEHLGIDSEIRLNPNSDYTAEIEALEKKAKENNQKVIIKFKQL